MAKAKTPTPTPKVPKVGAPRAPRSSAAPKTAEEAPKNVGAPAAPVVAKPKERVRKYLGMLGTSYVLSVGTKTVNGVEYHEIFTVEGTTFLLSPSDYQKQFKEIK